MKKILALILAMVLVLSLGACGAKEEAPATEAPAAEAPAEAPAAPATYAVTVNEAENGTVSGAGDYKEGEEELQQYLQRVADRVEFEGWYFGHFHEDTEVEDMFYCLYDDVVVL